ncbi:MAG: ParA family protein, partial [Clostridia bacterium]|nr:ParA family protein [Clostridia bacterium]
MKTAFERINIITGHYGSGKTNLSVNLALMFARQGRKVCLVDFDIVNPYFRAEDSRALLERSGVRVISSIYANSNLDIPAVPGEINSVFDDKSYTVLLDVGGDDAGAAALGQFSATIKSAGDYRHFYVFNARRPLTQTPQQAVDILREIERASRIPADALVNNTNLAIETDAAVIGDSAAYARAVSSLSGLPLAFTCVREGL